VATVRQTAAPRPGARQARAASRRQSPSKMAHIQRVKWMAVVSRPISTRRRWWVGALVLLPKTYTYTASTA
jgi:hypothetical protein